MSAAPDRPDGVRAPEGAVAWTVRDGFVTSTDGLQAVRGEGQGVLDVEDGMVCGVDGSEPLAAVVRMDRDLTDARAEIDSLYRRLRDIVDYADDRLSSRH
jgi:hypothetical protein